MAGVVNRVCGWTLVQKAAASAGVALLGLGLYRYSGIKRQRQMAAQD